MARALKDGLQVKGTRTPQTVVMAIQAMLKDTLNIEVTLRAVTDLVWFDEAQRNYDDHQRDRLERAGPIDYLIPYAKEGAAELLEMAQSRV